MEPATFFKKFELFADAPNAVAKMRELVLQLAVQGKLVAQEQNDEPASELLKQIYAKKTGRLFSSGTLTESTESNTNFPFTIPPSWQWVGATTPSAMISDRGKKVLTKDVLTEGIYPVVDQGKLFIRGYCNDPEKVILVTEPIVLFGDHTREMKLIDFDFVVGADGVKLLQPIGIDPYYYFWALRWLPLDSRGYGRHFKLLKAAFIPLPPLAEQKRIVAKVDELMALCDRLEAQQKERETKHTQLVRASLARFADAPTPANLSLLFHPSYAIAPDDLRKTILTLAVQGKLVPQDPYDEEPETALLTIHQERLRFAKAGKLRLAKVPANAFLEAALPFIPDSWRTVSFDHLAVVHNNALKAGPFGSALKKEFYVESGYKIYGQEQVIAGDPFIGDYYIDEKKFSELEACAVSTGDILISLVGTIGKILILPDSIEPGIINPRVIKLSLDASLVYPMFVKVLIGSPYAVAFFEENSHGGTMNILNLSILRALPIPLPPLAEQRRIVAKVDQLMALVDQLEAQLTTSRAAANKLMEAVVAELTAAQDDAAARVRPESSLQ